MVFENWGTSQINVNRYGILLNGGKLSKTDGHFYFQNRNEDESILEYKSSTTIEAGSYVDTSIAQGPYIVLSNANVTFIANDEITLSDGITAQEGSTFTASINNVSISMCRPAVAQSMVPNQANQSTANLITKPKFFSFSRIVPNPANQNTDLKFGLTNSQLLTLKLFDSYGREIKTIFDHIKFEAGIYSQNIETSHLKPGIYYCKLLSGSEEETLKLLK